MRLRNIVIGLGAVAIATGVIGWRLLMRDSDRPIPKFEITTPKESPANAAAPRPAAIAKDPGPSRVPAQTATSSAPAAKHDDLDALADDLKAATNTFFDPQYKLTGKLPDGWKMVGSPRWGTQETTLFFHDDEFPKAAPALYYRIFPEQMQQTPEQVSAWLRQQAEEKAKLRVSNGLTDYTNSEMVERTIGDRPALTWTGAYTRNGEPWGEYLTRVYTPTGTFLFFLHAPRDQLPALIPKFEQMINTTIVP